MSLKTVLDRINKMDKIPGKAVARNDRGIFLSTALLA